MKQQDRNWLTSFLDTTGLDWIPIIFDETKFPEYPRPTVERHKEIQAQTADLADEVVDEIVVYYEKLFENDDKRASTIESKAFSLMGITGIASSFIIGFAQFLLTNNSFPSIIRIVVMVLYSLIGGSLLITLLLARKAIVIGKYNFMAPDPLDRLELKKTNRNDIYRQYAADLLRSYENNLALINDKATYVRGAQDWFRNAILLLFILSMVFTIYLLFRPNLDVQVTPQPIPVFVVTVTSTPTYTPTYTPTLTPAPTSTSTPLATPTSSIPPTLSATP